MTPINVSNATHHLMAPNDWDKRNGECKSLAVIKTEDCIYSFWKPNWKERIKILFGKAVQVAMISENHPPIALDVK